MTDLSPGVCMLYRTLVVIFWLIGTCASSLSFAKEHDHHDHEKEEGRNEEKSPEAKEEKSSGRHIHNHAAGWRFQLATEIHLAAEKKESARESSLEDADFDLHVGPNYAGSRWEATVFLGLGRSLLLPLSNFYGWNIVFGGEFSAVILDPLHISTKVECESGLYRRRIAVNGGAIDYPPKFGCALLVGPELELMRWGHKQRGEWSVEALLGIGGEHKQQGWGETQFRFLLGTHFNF